MKRVSISTHRMMFVLSLIVLPLTALVCNGSPPRLEGDAAATATASPAPAFPIAISTSTGSEFNLEFSRVGSISTPEVSIQWGPNTALIPLVLKDGTYAGSYEGEFNAVVSGSCSGAYTYPVSVDVTAKEDGLGGLDFSVTTTMSMYGTISCAPGPLGNAPVTFTRTFKLPAEDGASRVYDIPMQSYGHTIDTYTLMTR